MTYTPFYPGGWQDIPNTTTPIDAAALNNIENGLVVATTPATNPAPSLQVATPLAGYALVNGTGVIVSWTAPSDGKNHRVMLFTSEQVTSALTGGQVTATVTTPDGNTSNPQLFAVNAGGGYHSPNAQAFNVKPGTTFSVQQASAVTVGAGSIFCEIWAS